MAKIKKRGESGAAKNYITRNQALKKLQLSLSDFRRLCILKGIFPRQPRHAKRANKGNSAPASFYYSKDIAFLQHEPVLKTLREHKAFAKKLSRALGRGEFAAAKGLEENKPVYRLDHIIKERYPTFVDSLRDLDDALSLLTLFANLPSNDRIPTALISNCARLCAEWQLYVMRTRSLRKVFLSIKGVYFQAEVRGQTITWLVPYMFTQHIPNDVDFRIMLTFLELYQTLLGFVLFKLYTDENLVYPPRFDEAKDAAGAGVGALALTEASAAALNGTSGADAGGGAGRTGGTRALDKDGNKVSPRDVKRQIKAISSQAGPSDLAKEDDEAATAPAAAADSELVEDVDQFVSQPSKSEAAASGSELATLSDLTAASASGADGQRLFAPYTFYISRECPRGVVEFVLRSFGATPSRVGWDEVAGAGSAVTESDERITHHIVDRPPATAGARPNHPGKRVYVQPQWIIDCANARRVLPHEPYAPGRTLPPHLSPFVDEEEVARRGGYIPAEARAQLGMDEDETAQIVEDDSSEDEDEEEAAEEEEADAAEKVERSALAALLADPADPTGALLDAAELEAEAAGGDTAKALADVRAQHAKAAKAAKKAGSAAAKGKAKGEDAEQREMARMLMSNKQKKLYNKLSYTAGKRGEEKTALEQKKAALDKAARKTRSSGRA